MLANLKSWASNKGWLVELLRRHPNWNEKALAVIHEVTHSREIERSTVNYHKYELMQLMDVLDLSNDGRLKLHGALDTITGTYSKTLPDTDRAIIVKEYCGVHCAVGQKTSRIINAICKKYGLDKHPEYNAKFAQLADSLNPLQIKRTALLSVHPCDYLEMSNRDNSWNSCHCLEGGEYHAGTLSYMNDACSTIFYTVDDGITESFYSFPKRTRQVFCFQNGILLQSRLYPSSDDNDTRDIYRNIVQKILADCLMVPNLWTLKREQEEIRHRISTHDDALHYPDYDHMCYRPNISLPKDANIDEDESIIIGHTAYCLDCSETIRENNTLHCDHCAEDSYLICDECGRRVHEDDAHYVDGAYYCDDCCSCCDDCNEYTTNTTEAYERGHYPHYVCASCLDAHYYCCDDCGEYFIEDRILETDDGFICDQCSEKYYAEYPVSA